MGDNDPIDACEIGTMVSNLQSQPLKSEHGTFNGHLKCRPANSHNFAMSLTIFYLLSGVVLDDGVVVT